jgi:hypothetical protein
MGGIWPIMALTVDGVDIQTTDVDSTEFTDYVFQVDLTSGIHTIGVSFLNDDYNPGVEDRNLYLDRLTIISPPGVDRPKFEVRGADGDEVLLPTARSNLLKFSSHTPHFCYFELSTTFCARLNFDRV